MNFEVHKYSIDNLIAIISKYSEASEPLVRSKHHSTYFKEYFDNVSAATIIVEKDYIDKDYLEDFASYYVKCFDPYLKRCTRIHFFSNPFAEKDFLNLLKGNETSIHKEDLQKSYLGFIVIKPLPSTVIGRSCLKTYNSEGHRHFPIIREYEANLYGIPFLINTIAFQEQDSVVAACATSALWSVFYGTGILFHHPIYSPAEITKKASEYLPTGTLETRVFPNKGLSIEQMAYAIRDLSLEPFLVNPINQFITQGTFYAYAKGKIPSLLGFSLYDSINKKRIGKHAVAVTGFNISTSDTSAVSDTDLHLTSSKIDKLYVHDDQVGPFARMIFENTPVNLPPDSYYDFFLKTFWRDENGNVGNYYSLPEIILVPLYHKIRIPYSTILNCIIYFNTFIEFLKDNSYLSLSSYFEWDIYLSTINDFKTSFLEQKLVSGQELFEILSSPLPHFMWRVTASLENQPVFDILFDATDIEQGDFFLNMIEYDKIICMNLRKYARNDTIFDSYKGSPASEILQFLRS